MPKKIRKPKWWRDKRKFKRTAKAINRIYSQYIRWTMETKGISSEEANYKVFEQRVKMGEELPKETGEA